MGNPFVTNASFDFHVLMTEGAISLHCASTGELGYDGPLYDRLLSMTDDMSQSHAYQVCVICI